MPVASARRGPSMQLALHKQQLPSASTIKRRVRASLIGKTSVSRGSARFGQNSEEFRKIEGKRNLFSASASAQLQFVFVFVTVTVAVALTFAFATCCDGIPAIHQKNLLVYKSKTPPTNMFVNLFGLLASLCFCIDMTNAAGIQTSWHWHLQQVRSLSLSSAFIFDFDSKTWQPIYMPDWSIHHTLRQIAPINWRTKPWSATLAKKTSGATPQARVFKKICLKCVYWLAQTQVDFRQAGPTGGVSNANGRLAEHNCSDGRRWRVVVVCRRPDPQHRFSRGALGARLRRAVGEHVSPVCRQRTHVGRRAQTRLCLVHLRARHCAACRHHCAPHAPRHLCCPPEPHVGQHRALEGLLSCRNVIFR